MNSTSKNEYIKIDEYKIQVPVIGLEHQVSGTKIDLIGAIHIASPSYYDQILSLLQQDDIVLYELCGGGKVDKQFKEKLLSFFKMNVSKLYREVAHNASNYYGKHLSKLNSLLSKINLDEITNPEADETKNDLRGLMEKFKQQSEILNADADMQLVYQGDKIDYNNLPDNRKHADLTQKELMDAMKVFSLENIYFLFAKISLIFIRKYFMKHAVEYIINGEWDSSMTSENNIWSKLHGNRENKLFKEIPIYENTVGRIGVLYGAGHLQSIEEHLLQCGYIRKSITYLDSIRKISKSIEEKR